MALLSNESLYVYVNVRRTAQNGCAMQASSGFADFRYDLLRRVAKIIGRDDGKTGVCKNILTLLNVGAFKANNERHGQVHFLGGGDDADDRFGVRIKGVG